MKNHLVWDDGLVTHETRAAQLSQRPCCIWLTGMPCSGKSSLAKNLDLALHGQGFHSFVLDGDNVRHGLCRDLGFSAADRSENARRVAETARLMVEAGLVVIVSLVSPFRADREFARSLFAADQFVEIHVDADLCTCEARDVKGQYAKARQGLIPDFTGIDSAYEAPLNPELRLDTRSNSREACSTALLALALQRIQP